MVILLATSVAVLVGLYAGFRFWATHSDHRWLFRMHLRAYEKEERGITDPPPKRKSPREA